MSIFSVYLFGKFAVSVKEQPLGGFGSSKVQELFSYLLLNRDHSYPRETLAGLLWGDNPTAQAKKYLRQALWQLQTALDANNSLLDSPVLQVEPDWVQVNNQADLWIDIGAFEQAYARVSGIPGTELDSGRAEELQRAIELYRGDLLEGWYQDWCIYERERLQNMYMAMLDKLMGYCEAHQQYDRGVLLGACLLHLDCAHERTHRRLMSLHYLRGDRTAALRQYQICSAALREELDIEPSESTTRLYHEIRTDHPNHAGRIANVHFQGLDIQTPTLVQALSHLRQVQEAFAAMQLQVQEAIKIVENVVQEQRPVKPHNGKLTGE